MSEKAFRLVLITVILIWIVFVLIPALLDFAPRAWATIQYFLPGENPRVLIIAKDQWSDQSIGDARVQIVLDRATLAGITDEKGQAIFEAVPAGRAQQIRVQKLDYEIGIITAPIVPGRQRARFQIKMVSNPGRRLYIGHESAAGSIGISLLDQASRLALTPPGGPAQWENLPALDLKVHYGTQRAYVLTQDRVIVYNLGDGSIVRQLALQSPAGGMALSPNGDTIYTYASGTNQRTHWLAAVDTRTWATRYSVELTTQASRAILQISSDGQRVYVAGVGDYTISVYEGRAARRAAIYRMNEPIKDMSLGRDDRLLYVLLDGSVIPVAVDVASNGLVTKVIENAPTNLFEGISRLVSAEFQIGQWLCLLNPATNQVIQIDLNSRNVYTIPVGREPSSFVPITHSGLLYVANKGSNTISIIALYDHKVIDTIDVRSRPIMLAAP